ncbi:hypothetical protein Glove_279g24 [Diversispora epigaea]|uniref:3CxxC-type domain-containing protein n=1 Tax=Diversispora epigaea TaxID=1348612 RepID=A0A397IA84_9GLOM|nr:hypothetical protein Glove_279g24 [Diversispora epigaea]
MRHLSTSVSMGQTISSIFEGNPTPSTKNSPCQYNTAKAIFVTNSQGTASSLPRSSNIGQKLYSVQPRKEDTSHLQDLEEVTAKFKNFTFKEEEEEETYQPRRYNYTFGDAISKAQYKKEPTSGGLGSQKKINFVNESFPPLPQSERRKIYEKKEDAAPSLQFNTATKSGMKISSTSESISTTSPFYRPVASPYDIDFKREQKEQGEKISQTLRHLNQILSPDNGIYGFWQCQCKNEKEIRLTSLQKLQNLTPEVLYNSFKIPCSVCRKENMITSFRVYTLPRYSYEEPTLEIIFHLIWKDYYRVFGEFKCQNCRRKWKSAYVWISFQKFIEKTPGPQLSEEDFYMQKCKKCKGKSSIFEYEPLQLSDGTSPHKYELCVKCQAGDTCRRTGNYLGKNIR